MNTFNRKSNTYKVRSKSASVGDKNSANVTTNSVTAIKSKPLKTYTVQDDELRLGLARFVYSVDPHHHRNIWI